jgi:transcriptional regulator with XRE-family HTH domain/anti-anti-sigma regulatory factor
MSELSRIRARTYKVDVQKVVALRKVRNWSQEKLALQIGMDPKTIQGMEEGRPKYKSTITRVAIALGLEGPDELILRESEPPPDQKSTANTAKPPRTVTLVFQLPREAFDDADIVTIVANISADAKTKDEIIVTDTKTGSVSIITEMSEDDALRIINAYVSGNLAHHNIGSILISMHAFDQPLTEEIIADVGVISFTKAAQADNDDNESGHFVEFVLAQECTKIVIDCARMPFISTGAILRLNTLRARAKALGRRVLLCNLDPVVFSDAFSNTGIDTLYEIHDDLASALRA